ncbi:MAG: hypothetical protein HGB37_02265 [Candidatus Moranbacteria bacterium]|nr:hypothetical protein [Candidatus Moranbacteria bacterium]
MNETDVIKFKELYEEETGDFISLEESLKSVQSLVEMVRLIYKPIRKDLYKRCTRDEDAI